VIRIKMKKWQSISFRRKETSVTLFSVFTTKKNLIRKIQKRKETATRRNRAAIIEEMIRSGFLFCYRMKFSEK